MRGYGRITGVGKNGDRFRVDVRGVYLGTFATREEAEAARQAHAATLPPPRKAPGGKRPRGPYTGHVQVRMGCDGARYVAKWRNRSLGVCDERKDAQALIDAAIADETCNLSSGNA
jgi:hypothetical protein